MVNAIHSFFVKADNICDYIPVISTLSNLTDLFEKHVVIPLMSRQSVIHGHYYTHLENKSTVRCVTLLVPVIGNLIVAIDDFINRKYNDRDFMLEAIKKDTSALQNASIQLRSDRNFMLKADAIFKPDYDSAQRYASAQLRDDRDHMFSATAKNGFALQYASLRVQQELKESPSSTKWN